MNTEQMIKTMCINSFKQLLEAIMQREHINQKVVAKRLNISESSICRYLQGEMEPRISFLAKVCLTFNISLETFLKDNGFYDLRTELLWN